MTSIVTQVHLAAIQLHALFLLLFPLRLPFSLTMSTHWRVKKNTKENVMKVGLCMFSSPLCRFSLKIQGKRYQVFCRMKGICIECQFHSREKRLKERNPLKETYSILPPSTPTNSIKLAKTHILAINHSRSAPIHPINISAAFHLYFLGLRTLHTACAHCSPCSFLAPFNQPQQATFVSFLHLMLHQAWLTCSVFLLLGCFGFVVLLLCL